MPTGSVVGTSARSDLYTRVWRRYDDESLGSTSVWGPACVSWEGSSERDDAVRTGTGESLSILPHITPAGRLGCTARELLRE